MRSALGITASANVPASGGGAWTPASLPGLVGWHDASNTGSLTVAVDRISQWGDLSGNGNHLTQPTTANQPHHLDRTINGKPALHFLGADVMNSTMAMDDVTSSMFAVVVFDDLDNYRSPLGSSATGGLAWVVMTSPDHLWHASKDAVADFGVAGPLSVGTTYALSGLMGAANVNMGINGTYTDHAHALVASGAFNKIGNVAGGSAGFIGVIGEIFYSNTTVSNADRDAAVAYLTAKWITPAAWTPASLPSVQGWWDGNDLASMTIDASNRVSQWADKAGGAHHLAQPSAGVQPTLSRGKVNGKNVVTFATNQNQLVANFPSIPADAVSAAFVVTHADTGPWTMSQLQGYSGYLPYANFAAQYYLYEFGDQGPQTSAVVGVPYLYTLVHTATGWKASVRGDGADVPWTPAGWGLSPRTLTQFVLGDLGGRGTHGDLCELIVSNAAFTDHDLDAIDAYFDEKWVPWTPARLPGIQSWYDASDLATITASGGSVSQWSDKVSNRHLLQASGGNQPKTGEVAVNGQNTLTFHNYMSMLSAVASGLPQPFTLWMVFKPWSNNAGVPHMSSASPAVYVQASAAAVFEMDAPTAVGVGGQVTSQFTGAFVFDGAASFMRMNGVTTNLPSSPGTNGLGALQVMAGIDNNMGSVAMVAVQAGRASAADIAAMETYATNKWTFTPASLPGLVGWWDASDAASITATAGKVSQWANKAPSAIHATQSTGTAQPVTGTRTINGRNVLDFAGSGAGNQVFNLASQPAAAAAAGTAFHVVAMDTASDGGGILGGWGSPAAGSHFPYTDGSVYDTFGNTAQRNLGNLGTYTTPHVYSVVSAAGDWRAYFDGVSKFTTATNTVGWLASPPPRIGAADSFSDAFFYDGRIAEIIVCNVALSTTDRQATEAYLKAKWGTP